MPEAYILSACRTPIGKFRGSLSSLTAAELGALAIREAIVRSGLTGAEVDEVILGNVLSSGVGQAPARQAALKAGLPATVSALTINMVCGSGLKAVMLAECGVRCGDVQLAIAGGMESMSQAPYILPRDGPALGARVMLDSLMHDGLTCAHVKRVMSEIANDLAAQTQISREDQDRFALESHRRAVEASNTGGFAAEIIPVAVRHGKEEVSVTRDDGPRGDTDLKRLASLSPSFKNGDSVTAGNSSMISDGAAAVVVGSADMVARSGKQPMARIVATATSGAEPQDLFIAPVQAVRQVVAQAGYSLADIDAFEINEAFAVQTLACMHQLGLSADRVNLHGGAVAIGHPIGASGVRVLVTLLHILERRNQRLGVASLCLGGGNAVAILVEREPPR